MNNTDRITFQGKAVSLTGRRLEQGMSAPDFNVLDSGLREVRIGDFKGQIKVFTSFPSIDTPVCDAQIKEFNKQAAQMSPEVLILGISKDLPFAQKRFCDTFDIKNVRLFSDYRNSSFGINYGLLIKELNLLARSVIIADKSGIIRYIQIVPELSSAPDYTSALKNLQAVLADPGDPRKEARPLRCQPCETGARPMSAPEAASRSTKLNGWELIEGKKLVREFKFNDFADAKYFFELVSLLAEEQGHHPTFNLAYNKLKVTLTTHAAAGLTDNDFLMGRFINELGYGQ